MRLTACRAGQAVVCRLPRLMVWLCAPSSADCGELPCRRKRRLDSVSVDVPGHIFIICRVIFMIWRRRCKHQRIQPFLVLLGRFFTLSILVHCAVCRAILLRNALANVPHYIRTSVCVSLHLQAIAAASSPVNVGTPKIQPLLKRQFPPNATRSGSSLL